MQIFQDKYGLSRAWYFKEGIWTDDHKVEAIKNWPISNMVTELWSFLQITTVILSMACKSCCPLYDQISGDNANKKKKKVTWTEECQKAFNVLKALCTSSLILAFTDFTKPFKLHMDASTTGLGVVVYQEQDGTYWVIGHASWALSKS